MLVLTWCISLKILYAISHLLGGILRKKAFSRWRKFVFTVCFNNDVENMMVNFLGPVVVGEKVT